MDGLRDTSLAVSPARQSHEASSEVSPDRGLQHHQQSISSRNQSLLQQAKAAQTSAGQLTSAGGQSLGASSMSISRQHLSARVKLLLAKVIDSNGAELRRTLFSLRQSFQDDAELASEFVEQEGFECLMKVAAMSADQIHQNYILRALGQLIDYPSGMNGLAKHNGTIQWLYTLLASQHKLVVKTALKLLLQFVEFSDNNCLHFCRSIKAIDETKGNPLWSNLIQIFKPESSQANQQQHQDVSLLLLAMTLVNKTLAGIPDQDTFYDFVDPLEEMGIEAIMERTGRLDGQLKEQFDIYDQVLRGEDEDEEEEVATEGRKEMLSGGQETQTSKRRYSVRYGSEREKSEGGGSVSAKICELTKTSKLPDSNTELESCSKMVASGQSTGSKEQKQALESSSEEEMKSAKKQQPEESNNLARGKQQRASISSCSSSDSYASYGSGYASGSGNSTDHELKRVASVGKQQQVAGVNSPAAGASKSGSGFSSSGLASASTSSLAGAAKTTTTSSVGSEQNKRDCSSKANKSPSENGEEEEESVQLRRHLSELEQLTDDLASRKIFDDSEVAARLAGARTDLITESAAGKLVGLVGCSPEATRRKPSPEQPQAGKPSCYANNDSRSTSTTPTAASSAEQQHRFVHSQSNTPSPASLPNKGKSFAPQASGLGNSGYPAPVVKTARGQDQRQPAASAGKLQQQQEPPKGEPYYHNLFQWEQLVSKGVTRPLLINDLDFTDLRDEDDADLLNGSSAANQKRAELTISIPAAECASGAGQQSNEDSLDSGTGSGSPKSLTAPAGPSEQAPPPCPPPPISPWFNTMCAESRPQSQFMSSPSPCGVEPSESAAAAGNRNDSPSNHSLYSNSTYASSRNSICLSNAGQPRDSVQLNMYSHGAGNQLNPTSLRSASSMSSLLFGNSKYNSNKRKKTMKLFWKEVREDRSLLSKLTKKRTIWDEIKPVQVDTQKLEHLFESKAKDLLLSKSRNGLDGMSQRKAKITVLDAKRSNAINIGMTKLPPMRTIKSAILKMDSSIMNREGIEKILTTMMPSEEEKSRIIEAQLANPDTPLGTAEQFLLNLASISALEARLRLWAFQLDYAQIEKEVAEPLMDLKQAIEEIERSETFRVILGTLLAIGNFLNSTNVKGFQIDYLEKVPEVKDTVHKHSLLHHLCLFIQEKYGEEFPSISESDLYSEFSAVNRASKVDYAEVAKNLKKMQQDCKASWDYLKIVAKHDGLANFMNTPASGGNEQSSAKQENCMGKPAGKLNNLSKLSMITTIIGAESKQTQNKQQGPPASSSSSCLQSSAGKSGEDSGQSIPSQSTTTTTTSAKQLKTKVSDFLTDCAERIMVLMVIHRRVMNRFQKLLVYLGCPSHQIKQTQPQQILKIINEFALEYRTKRERVREMLLKRLQQQQRAANRCPLHRQLSHQNRLLMGRARWAGSQQSISNEALLQLQRPCSTASSYASTLASAAGSSPNCPECLGAASCSGRLNQAAGSQQGGANQQRAGSPSGFSQISNYSDYLYDQSCCNSRQQSVTPMPSAGRPHSMSISMYDLPQQQAAAGQQEMLARQKQDEELRRILGAGKSFDGACNDLYQLSHWSSTMARVPHRQPPMAAGSGKFRAASIESSPGHPETAELEQQRRQSSYYRYLNGGFVDDPDDDDQDELEQNSDDEILQSLVRTVTCARSSQNPSGSQHQQHSAASRSAAKSKILSRISCDRKSLRRTLQGVEMAN